MDFKAIHGAPLPGRLRLGGEYPDCPDGEKRQHVLLPNIQDQAQKLLGELKKDKFLVGLKPKEFARGRRRR
ncbi:hypothetical protein [Bradyrhizobium sp. 33ap4]|uniref:hypothetical protein n=1 Tax=Bradyrhizobium sp. 33ap4 TaxID=3061630 RepID=UPI00292DB43C|nr:hypothetical protein [Bradyrhizobium sp. 33ap4]